MKVDIAEYKGSAQEDSAIASLLASVYVHAGFTDPALAEKMFAPAELKRRGKLILAKALDTNLIGMVICAPPGSPYRQVANRDEAEMQLLAVAPEARGHGIGRQLCLAFEAGAISMGFGKTVLSTQPDMQAAHKLYKSFGYVRCPARDWQRAGREFLVYEKSLVL